MALSGRLAALGLSVDLLEPQPGDPENYRVLEFAGRTAENADLLRRAGVGCLSDRRPYVRPRNRQPDRWTYEHIPTEISRFR